MRFRAITVLSLPFPFTPPPAAFFPPLLRRALFTRQTQAQRGHFLLLHTYLTPTKPAEVRRRVFPPPTWSSTLLHCCGWSVRCTEDILGSVVYPYPARILSGAGHVL